MKATTVAVFSMLIALAPAWAQQPQSDGKVPAAIAAFDQAAVSRSARASKIIGSKVYKGDTSIGQIEDVLIDLDHASIPAVVLSVGGFLGVGEKLVAVPVSQIKVGTEAKFTTDLTKDQLAAAPKFVFGKPN